MKVRRLIVMICSVWSLLFIPYFSSKLTAEVKWTRLDYLAMGVLLSCVAFSIEFILSRFLDFHNRIKYIIFVCLFFLFIWIQLAVGFF